MSKSLILTSMTLAGVLISGGCATKKYVAKTVDPVRDKVDTVATTTDKQGKDISQQGQQISQQGDEIKKQGGDIEKAQTDISANRERAMAADSRASDAINRASDAMKKADQVGTDLSGLRQVVANLDDYKAAGNTVISFGFNKDALTQEAKDELDKLVSDKTTMKRYFVAVEGFTDKTGTVAYNNQLSRRRAEAVMQYLVAKHDIPVYRIHIVGLGEEKPADEGRDRAARAKNRRVEVTIFTADNTSTRASASAPTGDSK